MKIGVLTDAETASGYRLAGLEAVTADPAEAAARLSEMILSNQYALIAVDESLLPDPNKAAERTMRGRSAPVLLTLPNLLSAFSGGGDAKAYMRQLVRETIGFDIKL
ncbi:MAG: V-type ATP synthase subunit F [Meiothermus sp.]